VTALSLASGSFAGGTPLRLTGRGFSAVPSRNAVSVCGVACAVSSAGYDSLTCSTGAAMSLSAWTAAGKPVSLINSSALVSSGYNATRTPTAAFDGNIETTALAAVSFPCTIGFDLGADRRAVVTRIRFFPNFRRSQFMQNGVFEGSNDNSRYTTLATNVKRVQEGWNFVDITDSTPYQYLRYRGPSNPANAFCEVCVCCRVVGCCSTVVRFTVVVMVVVVVVTMRFVCCFCGNAGQRD
jgi:hypothetical protein